MKKYIIKSRRNSNNKSRKNSRKNSRRNSNNKSRKNSRKNSRKKSQKNSRENSRRDGVKKSNFLLPLLASSSLFGLPSPVESKGVLTPVYYTNKISTDFDTSTCSIIPENMYDETNLTFAIKNGNNGCAKDLINESTVNQYNTAMETPLSAALYAHNNDMIEYLIKNGADVNKKSFKDTSPLSETRDNQAVKLLLDNGAIIDYKDKKLLSKIKVNFESLNKDYIKIFIDHGIDLKIKDYKGIPLYSYAILSGNVMNTLTKTDIMLEIITFLTIPNNLDIRSAIIIFYSIFLFYMLYPYYPRYSHYIPPLKKERIKIRLFKSFDEIQENISLKNKLENRLLSNYGKIISTKLQGLITLSYLKYKYNNACVISLSPYKYILKNGIENPYIPVRVTPESTISMTYYEKIKQIMVPTNFWDTLKKCLDKPGVRFIIFYFSFKCIDTGHANFMVCDLKFKSLERFEPHGFTYGDDCISAPVDDMILDLFNKNMGKEFVKNYYKPLDFCPSFNVQAIESSELLDDKGDPGGFCAAWSYFYADLRLANPEIDRKQLVTNLIYQLTYNEKSFRDFIREYSIFLTEIYETVLKAKSEEDLENIYHKLIEDLVKT